MNPRPLIPALAALRSAQHAAKGDKLRGEFLRLWRATPGTYALPTPQPEVNVSPWRRWRWDLAWRVGPAGVCLDFQGGVFMRGPSGHHGAGQQADADKAMVAQAQGWLTLTMCSGQITPARVALVAEIVAAYEPPRWAIETARVAQLLPMASKIVRAVERAGK